ncbi:MULTISPECIES: hypothetical protein [unclassified Streptomyces]|uniref:hypothetical protein n=1 Tax=unclassified Streptomyces TaxID=2593676 RepID=UPI0004CA9F2B|nr:MULTISPECIES: hypothetical protein [unclassified Streptomyces]KOV73370.1 hypothetical protein ADL02_40050 [Streptomyces sp. NRRL WC-3723]
MLALAHLMAAAPHPAPAVPAHLVPYDGPRVAVADFFTLARQGRAVTTPPPFRDGDCVSCPRGTEWLRHDGRWIVPGQPHGLALADRTVTLWWQTRTLPGSRFALVHRLTPAETSLITGDHYSSSFRALSLRDGAFTYTEPVTGAWLRSIAWQAARTRTVSVHLELPTGIVTLHSRVVGDVFFHPATAATPALCA